MSVRREANRAATCVGSRPAYQRTMSQPWLPQSSHAPPSARVERPARVRIAREEPVDVERDELAGRAVGDEVVTDLDRLQPARDLGQAELHAGRLAGLVHGRAFLDREGHRLLEQDVLAGRGRGQDVGQVRGVRGRDDHRVDVRPLEQGLDRRLRLGAELRRQGRRAGAARDRHDPGPARLLLGDGHGVDVGHLARPDQPEPDRHRSCLLRLPRPSSPAAAGRGLAPGHRDVRLGAQR